MTSNGSGNITFIDCFDVSQQDIVVLTVMFGPRRHKTIICASSIEVVDFSTSILESNIMVRITKNGNSAKENILLGRVKEINEGNVTRSLTCYSYLFSYMLYYYHFIPAVRIYDVKILNSKNKTQINQAIIICHVCLLGLRPMLLFKMLESGPDKIEVCQWAMNNNLIWMVLVGALR
jgi:hypothetical protein